MVVSFAATLYAAVMLIRAKLKLLEVLQEGQEDISVLFHNMRTYLKRFSLVDYCYRSSVIQQRDDILGGGFIYAIIEYAPHFCITDLLTTIELFYEQNHSTS